MRMSSTEKITAIRRVLTVMMTLMGVIMFSGLLQAQSLLIDVSVSNTTPGASDVFTYKIRYRCASITQHCFNSHITYTFPAAYDIVTPPSTGGNVASVTITGNAVDVYLVSPSSAGAPAGALAAGASGILETAVRFKCGINGTPPMPPAGTTVNFVALPTFTVTGGSQTAAAPPAVTVPTVSACSPTPPAPPVTSITKTNSDNDAVIQQGEGITIAGGHWYTFNIPATAQSFILEDDIPEGIYPLTGFADIDDEVFTELYVNGVWYPINSFGPSGYQNNDFSGFLASVPFGTQFHDDNNVLIPGLYRLLGYGTNVYTIGIDKMRFTFSSVATAGLRYINYGVAPDAPVGASKNCATITNPPPGWSSTICTNDRQITDKPVITATEYADPYFSLGISSLASISGQNLYILSGNPNLYKDPLDALAFTTITAPDLLGGGLVYETLLPVGFEYSTDPLQPNFWLVLRNGPVTAPACENPSAFTAIPNYNGTGQTLLRWEFPGCVSYFNSRIYFTARYTLSTPLPNSLCFDGGTIRRADGGQFAYYLNTGAPYNCGTSYNIPDRCLNRPTSSGGGVNSIKWVKGALDANFSRYPLTGNTNLAGDGVYEIYVTSADWQNVKQLDVADILPYIGDQGMLSSALRGSGWSEELASAITVERYKIGTGLMDASANLPFGVMYTTAANPCYLDAAQPTGQVKADVALANFGMAPGCSDFSGATPPAGAKGFLFRWANTADPLVFGEYLKLTINVRQLTGEADVFNQVAWNSVAFTATEADNDELLSSEPLKVGLKMIDPNTTAAIGDYVWLDDNANGRQDAGEAPLAGVVVSLYDAAGQPVTQSVLINGVPTNVPVTTITNANGYYCFPGLTPNTNYYVRLESANNFGNGGNLATYTLTTTNAAGVPDDQDSDAALGTLAGSPVTPRPQILSPTLAGGTQTKTYDFGFVCPGKVTGYVWMDSDNGGDQNNSEMGLSGVTVTLRNAITNAAVGSPVMSDANGAFTLSNIPSGYYYVEYTNFPSGKIPTFKDLTGNDNNDSDVNGTGKTDAFSLGSCDFLDFDLGLRNPPVNPASICGTAWDDLDKDGTFDVGEPGMPNVTVQLLLNGFVINTTTTDANGDYCFTNLDPNVGYQLAFVPPAVSIMFSAVGPDQDVDLMTGVTTTYTPTDNQIINNVDAGFMGPLSIGNLVWNDVNGNGLYDNNEPIFSGVTVRLIASDGTTVLGTTTTDADGRYIFKYLMAGSYFVEVGVPTGGYRSTVDAPSTPTPNLVDSDDNGVGLGSSGFIRSNAIVLVNTGGTAGDANWTETDANQPIMGCFDPAINRKAYYTVDFGFYYVPPCPVIPCGITTVIKN